ncbi:MAG: TMEM175 family protein [Ginsengibacter sp.]
MIRKIVAKKLFKETEFRFRGHEVRRIEAFSDAVFAFAVTLLIVSLEVPKNFEELMNTMRGFMAFGVTFLLLMLLWYEQNIFFRRYGMDDLKTIILNCALIFLVLFYVYPLKFLFATIFNNAGDSLAMKDTDMRNLMLIYSCGYICIYFLFLLMHIHAFRKRVELSLKPAEIFETKTSIFKHLILIVIGLISIMAALLLSPEKAGLAGMVYFLIGPAFTLLFTLRKAKKNKLYKLQINNEK